MTYGDIKRMTLELCNRYSVAGETVSPAYNNQSDIIQRIPNLINAALTQIDVTLRPTDWEREPVEQLTGDPSDTQAPLAPVPWLQAACYYAAAYLVMDRDEFAYAALMNEFETFLRRLTAGRVRAEFTPVRDAYAFHEFGGA